MELLFLDVEVLEVLLLELSLPNSKRETALRLCQGAIENTCLFTQRLFNGAFGNVC